MNDLKRRPELSKFSKPHATRCPPQPDVRILGQMDIRVAILGSVLTATVAPLIGHAGAQTQDKSSPITLYLQVSDARFDSYLYVKKNISAANEAGSSDQFFYIPRPNSKERERELAEWRRRFRLIVSAATLSESAQSKISRVKEEFVTADRAAECWMLDHDRERRITVTIIGSASETAIAKEYRAAGRDFSADPRRFTCKYTYKLAPSEPEP